MGIMEVEAIVEEEREEVEEAEVEGGDDLGAAYQYHSALRTIISAKD